MSVSAPPFSASAPAAPAPEAPAPAAPPAPEQPVSALAEGIRALRADRASKAEEAKKSADVAAENARLRDELGRFTGRKLDAIEDTDAWATAMGYTKEERVFLGENLLYSLAPDRAPADWRVRVLETRDARRQRLAESEKSAESERAARESTAATIQQYSTAVAHALRSSSPGTYPDSDAWFGDNTDARHAALMGMADNLAEIAREKNEVADLTYDAVARALEKEMTVRFDRRASRGSAPTPTPQTPGSLPAATQHVAEKPIAQGLTSAGTPRPPAMTDAERAQRAAQLLPW